jgi:hypothetical protein
LLSLVGIPSALCFNDHVMLMAQDRQVVHSMIVVITVDVVGFESCRGLTPDAVVYVLALVL